MWLCVIQYFVVKVTGHHFVRRNRSNSEVLDYRTIKIFNEDANDESSESTISR